MRSIVREILELNEEIINDIDFENDKHPLLKSFGCGVVEGLIDSAFLFYIPTTILAFVWKHKALNKK